MSFNNFIFIYKKLFVALLDIFRCFYKTSKNLTNLKLFIISILRWNLRLFLINTICLVYFYNYSFFGKGFFYICSFFTACTGAKDPDSIFQFGFAGIIVFIYANLVLYTLVQVDFVKNLLIESIGTTFFEQYVGNNTGIKAVLNAIALGKTAAVGVVAINVFTACVHYAETEHTEHILGKVLDRIDFKDASETTKVEVFKVAAKHIETQAPYRSPIDRCFGSEGTKTLGSMLDGFNKFMEK